MLIFCMLETNIYASGISYKNAHIIHKKLRLYRNKKVKIWYDMYFNGY